MKTPAIAEESSAQLSGGDKVPDALLEEFLEAESVLAQLASVFFPPEPSALQIPPEFVANWIKKPDSADEEWPDVAARYRILVEQIPAVVFMAFLDKGIGEAYVSPQIEATLGFKQEEWLNDPVRWYRQIHPDDKLRWSTEAAQMFLTGQPLRSVYRVISRDGRVIWFHCEAKMVRHDDGRPWFVHGVGFDISELKQTEEALGQSEQMLRGIFESAPDTMLVVDSRGYIERANAQIETMFGYPRVELIGQRIEILLPERLRHQHIAHRAGYLADPHLRPMSAGLDLYGRRRDGSEFPVEIMLSPIKAEVGGLVIAIVRDITRRKQAEAEVREYAERMQVLSRRLIEVQEAERRRIALELHDEIGQLLTGLKLTLEMGARQSSGEASESIAQAQTLVNELMARARKLSLDLRPATLDHLGLLSALLWHIKHYTAQTQIRVAFKQGGLETRRFSPEIETAVYRIVQEALTNVARHAQTEEVTVRVWADRQQLAIQIEDQGRGFNPQAALATDSTSGLTGMRERVSLLGGQFLIESSPGAGTRLTAELNLDDNPDGRGPGESWGAQL